MVKSDIHVLDNMSSQGLANVAWSYARQGLLGMHGKDTSLAPANPADGRLGVYLLYEREFEGVVELFRRISSITSAQKLATYSGQDLSNIVYSFGVLGSFDEAMFAQIGDEIASRYKRTGKLTLNVQEIANCMWGFSVCDFRHDEFCEAVGGYLSDAFANMEGKSKMQIANIAWSMVVMEMHLDERNRAVMEEMWRYCNTIDAKQGAMPQKSIMSLMQVSHTHKHTDGRVERLKRAMSVR